MKYSELKKIIKRHGLRITDCRIDVLSYFIQYKKALTFKNLEDQFEAYDRVTLYRTLSAFEEHGLLHKIPDDSGFATYGLCQDCSTEAHHHNHIHFKCLKCEQLECIDDTINISIDSLPKNYIAQDMDVIIKGVCQQCNSN